MHGRLLKLVILIIAALGSVAGMALAFMSWGISQDVALTMSTSSALATPHGTAASGDKSDDKSASQAQNTSHGSSPASHGAADAGTDTNGHGAGASAKPEGKKDKAHGVFVSLDEVVTNVGTIKPGGRLHSLSIQLDLELFDEQSREVLEKNTAAIKDIVIITGVEQKYEDLNTTPGRLYFKELLISRMNERVNQPIVRDVQFVAFYLQ